MKLHTKTGSESEMKKEERSLIMGGYSRADKACEKDLQPFEYIWTSEDDAESDGLRKISWLE